MTQGSEDEERMVEEKNASAPIEPEGSDVNAARRLASMAMAMPSAVAIAEPCGRRGGRRRYQTMTFAELNEDSDRIACGLRRLGVKQGTRLVLLVRPGIDFISLVFALLKSGAVAVLIDPGMGRRHLIRCLEDVQAEGFVAVPRAHALRVVLRRRFPRARLNVTVGRRWFWGGTTLAALRQSVVPEAGNEGSAATGAALRPWSRIPVAADDPAAIIFTSGGTGPPKGVLFTHGNFNAQVEQIRDRFAIRPGEVDVPCFPLFGLFNCAMGVTAVIPKMNASRPATVDPRKIIEAVSDWQATQAFGSPAVWRRVGDYCATERTRLDGLRRVLSAGAPVPLAVLERMLACIDPACDVFTPYGATEALPVAAIGARQVLAETAARTRDGAGVCVGTRFSGIDWKIIAITDAPIPTLAEARELPPGEIGELIVCGAVVTRAYVTRVEANALAKIADGDRFWHRMGDVGYLDANDRFWMCGRKVHRVETPRGTLFSVPCEAIFNQHPAVLRSALVGVGPRGRQAAAIVVEPRPGCMPRGAAARAKLIGELRLLGSSHPLTAPIAVVHLHPAFPVDVRHNVKIDRERLAAWVAARSDAGRKRRGEE